MQAELFTGGRRKLPLRFLTWLCFFFGSLMYWELLLHFSVFGELTGKFFYAVGFSLTLSAILTLFLSFFPKKVSYWIAFSLSILIAILFGSQLVYYFVFGSLYSISLVGEGGAAITTFWKETLSTMLTHLPQLILLFVPMAALLIFKKFFRNKLAPLNYV